MLGAFITLIFPSLASMRRRAERVICIGNLRSLYVSLNTCLIDKKQWPQIPADYNRDLVPKFWTQVLEPYGATQTGWTCPSLRRIYDENPQSFEEYPEIHYTPAEFDEKPTTPHQWPSMPWVLEVGSVHGDGNILIRADGGIRNLNELLKEVGADPLPGMN